MEKTKKVTLEIGEQEEVIGVVKIRRGDVNCRDSIRLSIGNNGLPIDDISLIGTVDVLEKDGLMREAIIVARKDNNNKEYRTIYPIEDMGEKNDI